jgi:hypothetical protein
MLPSSVRIFVCTVPQDMRRSFDTLAAMVEQLLGKDPRDGALYVCLSGQTAHARQGPLVGSQRILPARKPTIFTLHLLWFELRGLSFRR